MSRRDEILNKVSAIPALPASATQAIRLIQSETTGLSDIMKAIEYDVSLTADVLRLANSAYFAGPRQISSLREAGVLLGAARILQLVLASAVFPVASRPIKGYDLPANDLLDHLLAVAIGAEELGKRLRVSVPHYTFTAGLLHDIGKIVLGTFLEVDGEAIRQVAFEEQISFEAAEDRVLGINHAEVGAALLESWQLPEGIVQVVRWHHSPELAGAEALTADLVHAADMLSIECGLGVGVDGLNYRIGPDVAERLRLKATLAEQVTAAMLTELQAIRAQRRPTGGAA